MEKLEKGSDESLAKQLHLAKGQYTLLRLIESLQEAWKFHPIGDMDSIDTAAEQLRIFMESHSPLSSCPEGLFHLEEYCKVALINATSEIYVTVLEDDEFDRMCSECGDDEVNR